MQPSITVSGNGNSRATPDMATVRIGVIARGKTAEEAQNEANSIMSKLIDRLTALKISKNDIQTENLSLNPDYGAPPPEGGQAPIRSYSAMNTLAVRVNDLSLIGRVIDAGVSVGSNYISGVSFGLRDDAKATREALQDAVRDARLKAQSLADALGVEIVEVLDVQEGGPRIMPPIGIARAEMAQAAVMPGQVEVGAMVTVRFAIRPKRT